MVWNSSLIVGGLCGGRRKSEESEWYWRVKMRARSFRVEKESRARNRENLLETRVRE